MSETSTGPWKSEVKQFGRGLRVQVRSADGRVIAVMPHHVSGPYGAKSVDRREADAHLIAASPELLQALETGVKWFPQRMYEEIQALLAKARGGAR